MITLPLLCHSYHLFRQSAVTFGEKKHLKVICNWNVKNWGTDSYTLPSKELPQEKFCKTPTQPAFTRQVKGSSVSIAWFSLFNLACAIWPLFPRLWHLISRKVQIKIFKLLKIKPNAELIFERLFLILKSF